MHADSCIALRSKSGFKIPGPLRLGRISLALPRLGGWAVSCPLDPFLLMRFCFAEASQIPQVPMNSLPQLQHAKTSWTLQKMTQQNDVCNHSTHMLFSRFGTGVPVSRSKAASCETLKRAPEKICQWPHVGPAKHPPLPMP